MYVVIAGCGRVGARLATDLAADGHDVVVVDAKVDNFRTLGPTFNGMTIQGNAIDAEVLRDAGIEKADAFAGVTNDDAVNIMAAQIAARIFAVPRVAARVSEPGREPVFHEFGLLTVCGTNLASDQLRTLLLKEGIHHRTYFGSSEVAEVEIAIDGDHANMAVTDLNMPERFRLICVLRDGHAFIPNGGYRTFKGDTLVAAVRVDAFDAVERTFRNGR